MKAVVRSRGQKDRKNLPAFQVCWFSQHERGFTETSCRGGGDEGTGIRHQNVVDHPGTDIPSFRYGDHFPLVKNRSRLVQALQVVG